MYKVFSITRKTFYHTVNSSHNWLAYFRCCWIFWKNNELSGPVNLGWTWPLLLPVIEFFSQLFTGYDTRPPSHLSEARKLQTGRLMLTDVMIVSILSMLPAEPYYSITMDTSQPRTWIAHDRLFEEQTDTCCICSQPQWKTLRYPLIWAHKRYYLTISLSLYCLYLTILWRLSRLLLFLTFLVVASCKQGRYARNNSGTLCT